jgi:ribosomal protein S14
MANDQNTTPKKMCAKCGEREALASIDVCAVCAREMAAEAGLSLAEFVRAIEVHLRAVELKEYLEGGGKLS